VGVVSTRLVPAHAGLCLVTAYREYCCSVFCSDGRFFVTVLQGCFSSACHLGRLGPRSTLLTTLLCWCLPITCYTQVCPAIVISRLICSSAQPANVFTA
jgi:hypothetical protein